MSFISSLYVDVSWVNFVFSCTNDLCYQEKQKTSLKSQYCPAWLLHSHHCYVSTLMSTKYEGKISPTADQILMLNESRDHQQWGISSNGRVLA